MLPSFLDLDGAQNPQTEDELVFDFRKHISPYQLFIGNIPYSSTEASVFRFFEERAPGKLMRLQMERKPNGGSKGYGVGFTRSEQASIELIKQFNGRSFQGRDLQVRFNKVPEQTQAGHKKK